MIITIIIAFVSLIGLLVIHEFGHFSLAKFFGVRVDEFGIGYPPRIFGKKFKETIYSVNLLPFGAFVRLPAEMGESDDPKSFAKQPLIKRALIIFGGALSFWIVAFILISIIFGVGAPVAVEDFENENVKNPYVQMIAVASDSPAQKAGLKAGDIIKELSFGSDKIIVTKIKDVQDFSAAHKGEEITLKVQRISEVFDVNLVPRVSFPNGEGSMGIGLTRVATKTYPWYQAPIEGIKATFNLTLGVIQGWYYALSNVLSGKPSGAEMMGPIGIFHLFTQASQVGTVYFLNFIAVISIYIALFNMLPIPSFDGGKLMFLAIEAIRRKPVKQKTEERVTAFFFLALLALMALVTIKDIIRIF